MRRSKRAGPIFRSTRLSTSWAAKRCRRRLVTDLGDVLGRRTLGALNNVELDPLTFGEGAETAALDCRVVDETVLLTAFWGDEAKPLRVVEPLHGARGACHCSTP